MNNVLTNHTQYYKYRKDLSEKWGSVVLFRVGNNSSACSMIENLLRIDRIAEYIKTKFSSTSQSIQFIELKNVSTHVHFEFESRLTPEQIFARCKCRKFTFEKKKKIFSQVWSFQSGTLVNQEGWGILVNPKP